MHYIDNDVVIEIYDGTTRVLDISNDLDYPERIGFTTHIPGGDYGNASFFVERDVAAPILFEIGHRVVMVNGQVVVYEGFISGINRIIESDYQGIEFICSGGTDWHLMKYPLEKRWADKRIGEDVWAWVTSANGAELCTLDRNNRLRFTPKNEVWADTKQAQISYKMPTGQTVKRITFNYDLQESTQNWQLICWSPINGTLWNVSASGTGSQDITLGTPDNNVQLFFKNNSGGPQTPLSDGTIYGQFSNVVVYSETDNPITMTTITQDIAAEVSGAGYLNSSTVWIGTPGTPLTLEPFITNGYPSVADILNDAVSRGDGAYNRWVWGVRDSSYATTPNGKPVLYLEQYPDTDDWEYEVDFEDENLAAGVELLQDGAAIANHLITNRTDASGRYVYQTPADDANLADATSKTGYRLLAGVRLDTGDCEQTEATAYARRFLATYKDPPYKLLRPLILINYIRRKTGSDAPVRQIRPGERVKLTSFVSPLSGIEPVFVITSVVHNLEADSVSISTGVPSAPIGARRVIWPVSAPPNDAVGGGGSGGGSSGGGGAADPGWNWWERFGQLEGISATGSWQNEPARVAWLKMSQAERNKWKKTTWKKSRRKGGRKGE